MQYFHKWLDRILFHRMNTKTCIFTRAYRHSWTGVLHLVFIRWNKIRPYTKKIKYPLYISWVANFLFIVYNLKCLLFNAARYRGLKGQPEIYYRDYFFNTNVLLFIFSINRSNKTSFASTCKVTVDAILTWWRYIILTPTETGCGDAKQKEKSAKPNNFGTKLFLSF